jgi:hypothetical protein
MQNEDVFNRGFSNSVPQGVTNFDFWLSWVSLSDHASVINVVPSSISRSHLVTASDCTNQIMEQSMQEMGSSWEVESLNLQHSREPDCVSSGTDADMKPKYHLVFCQSAA